MRLYFLVFDAAAYPISTGPGIYHGSLSFPSPSADQLHPGDGIIESASLIPYPAEPPSSSSQYRNDQQEDEDEEGRTEVPLSMALTEWHFVLLYSDKVRVIELLSDKVVFKERLDLVSLSLRSLLTCY